MTLPGAPSADKIDFRKGATHERIAVFDADVQLLRDDIAEGEVIECIDYTLPWSGTVLVKKFQGGISSSNTAEAAVKELQCDSQTTVAELKQKLLEFSGASDVSMLRLISGGVQLKDGNTLSVSRISCSGARLQLVVRGATTKVGFMD